MFKKNINSVTHKGIVNEVIEIKFTFLGATKVKRPQL